MITFEQELFDSLITNHNFVLVKQNFSESRVNAFVKNNDFHHYSVYLHVESDDYLNVLYSHESEREEFIEFQTSIENKTVQQITQELIDELNRAHEYMIEHFCPVTNRPAFTEEKKQEDKVAQLIDNLYFDVI